MKILGLSDAVLHDDLSDQPDDVSVTLLREAASKPAKFSQFMHGIKTGDLQRTEVQIDCAVQRASCRCCVQCLQGTAGTQIKIQGACTADLIETGDAVGSRERLYFGQCRIRRAQSKFKRR